MKFEEFMCELWNLPDLSSASDFFFPTCVSSNLGTIDCYIPGEPDFLEALYSQGPLEKTNKQTCLRPKE